MRTNNNPLSKFESTEITCIQNNSTTYIKNESI